MYFDVYRLKIEGLLFPRKQIISCGTIDDIRKLGLTDDEIIDGICTGDKPAEPVRGFYIIDFAPEFLGNLKGEHCRTLSTIRMTGNPHRVRREIARELNISLDNVRHTLNNALAKLRATGQDKELFRLITRLYDKRVREGLEAFDSDMFEVEIESGDRREFEVEITEHIEIEIES
jgi:hypothetical protein